jgi:toxin YoeB
MNSSRNIKFSTKAFEDFVEWVNDDKKVFFKLADLIEEIRRTPFEGKGKPEPLKHDLKGFWSRRITQEHRVVYHVTDDEIYILSCRYHYE